MPNVQPHEHAEPIPAPGFSLVSGKRSPPDDGRAYMVQFRNGLVVRNQVYTAKQMVWKHLGHGWDIVAVSEGEKR